MRIHLPISWHPFDVLTMQNTNHEWMHEHNCITKTGGEFDVYFKAQIRHDEYGRLKLKVYGLDSGSVTIDLKTKSEKRAKELADNYLDSINTINYGLNDEFDLH